MQGSPQSDSRLCTGLDRILEGIVLALMATLAVLVVTAVVFRKMGSSLGWYDEVASILLAWLTFYGASLAALRGAHIGFPGLVRRLPQNLRIGLLLVREVVVIVFLLGLAWAGWRVLVVMGTTSLVSLPWIPYRLTHSVIPIGACFFLAAEFLRLPQRYRVARRGIGEDRE